MTEGTRSLHGVSRRTGSVGAASLALAVVAISGATHAAAQTPTQVVIVAPTVACRVAPSRSASLSEVLRQTGDAWRERVEVRDSASDAAGEAWVAVGGPDLRGRCWLPRALVAPARGATALRVMADRILEAPEAHSLAEWVAVHNFFVDPLHREEVAGSAILGLRRLEVLMGALKVAQARWSDHEDPVTLAWLESLGDDVEFSSERRGLDRWTVSRRALDALHQAHRDDPAAEEILWKSARYPYVPEECWRSLRCLFDIPLRGLSSTRGHKF